MINLKSYSKKYMWWFTTFSYYTIIVFYTSIFGSLNFLIYWIILCSHLHIPQSPCWTGFRCPWVVRQGRLWDADSLLSLLPFSLLTFVIAFPIFTFYKFMWLDAIIITPLYYGHTRAGSFIKHLLLCQLWHSCRTWHHRKSNVVSPGSLNIIGGFRIQFSVSLNL